MVTCSLGCGWELWSFYKKGAEMRLAGLRFAGLFSSFSFLCVYASRHYFLFHKLLFFFF